MTLFWPSDRPQLASTVSKLAGEFGTKGGFLAALPPCWTPEFILISASMVEDLASEKISKIELPDVLQRKPLILRSSVIGETIWDRGTFLTVPLADPPDQTVINKAILDIRADAQRKRPGVAVAVIVQRFLPDCEKGTIGNLNRLSKTREHWSRFTDIGGYDTAPDRFNSQRDAAADPRIPLVVSAHRPIDRLFGSACRWLIDHFGPVLNRDRMLLRVGVCRRPRLLAPMRS